MKPTKPTKPGYYWVKGVYSTSNVPKSGWHISEVVSRNGLIGWEHENGNFIPAGTAYWFGPLKPPDVIRACDLQEQTT